MSLPHRCLLLQPEHPLEASVPVPTHTACLAPVCKLVSSQTQHGMQGGGWGADLILKKLLAAVGSVIDEVAARTIGVWVAQSIMVWRVALAPHRPRFEFCPCLSSLWVSSDDVTVAEHSR